MILWVLFSIYLWARRPERKHPCKQRDQFSFSDISILYSITFIIYQVSFHLTSYSQLFIFTYESFDCYFSLLDTPRDITRFKTSFIYYIQGSHLLSKFIYPVLPTFTCIHISTWIDIALSLKKMLENVKLHSWKYFPLYKALKKPNPNSPFTITPQKQSFGG